MSRKVITMETKIAAMIAQIDAGVVTVIAACDGLGMSRQTYYKWQARFDAEGLSGLIELSGPAGRTPARMPPTRSRWPGW